MRWPPTTGDRHHRHLAYGLLALFSQENIKKKLPKILESPQSAQRAIYTPFCANPNLDMITF